MSLLHLVAGSFGSFKGVWVLRGLVMMESGQGLFNCIRLRRNSLGLRRQACVASNTLQYIMSVYVSLSHRTYQRTNRTQPKRTYPQHKPFQLPTRPRSRALSASKLGSLIKTYRASIIQCAFICFIPFISISSTITRPVSI